MKTEGAILDSITIGKLSLGERLLIHRRRNGWSQPEAAEDFAVSLYQYRAWEGNRGDVPGVVLGGLHDYEVCYLLRVRSGKTITALAKELKVSRFWLGQMELGQAPDDRLTEYWSKPLKPWRGRAR